jgi:hypothetical protein
LSSWRLLSQVQLYLKPVQVGWDADRGTERAEKLRGEMSPPREAITTHIRQRMAAGCGPRNAAGFLPESATTEEGLS